MSRTMDKTGALAWIEDKIAAVTHLPVHYGEAFNVLRYEPTQHYDSHYDTFDPKDFGKQYTQRIATFLIFLQAADEGGETVFKREGEENGDRVSECNEEYDARLPKTYATCHMLHFTHVMLPHILTWPQCSCYPFSRGLAHMRGRAGHQGQAKAR